ncbi:MAG: glycerophosphodiester phosphodiesterase family protein [bacterium]
MVIKIGHRGAGGYAPGNTLLSVQKALTFKLDYIEIDVSVCKSGEIVAVHDTRVDQTTDGSGFVTDKTFKELSDLIVTGGQKIPTLQEILDLIDRKIRINIEIKGTNVARSLVNLIKTYVQEKNWRYSDFLISSFNHYELKQMYGLCPDVKMGAVIAGIPIGYAESAQKLHAYSIHLSKEFITPEFVDDAHRRDLKVFVYTINDAAYYEKVTAMGVDGIFTDFPDLFI